MHEPPAQANTDTVQRHKKFAADTKFKRRIPLNPRMTIIPVAARHKRSSVFMENRARRRPFKIYEDFSKMTPPIAVMIQSQIIFATRPRDTPSTINSTVPPKRLIADAAPIATADERSRPRLSVTKRNKRYAKEQHMYFAASRMSKSEAYPRAVAAQPIIAPMPNLRSEDRNDIPNGAPMG